MYRIDDAGQSRVPLLPRDIRFAADAAIGSDWNGDAFRTAFFNAMSMLFPHGEKSFVESVRAHERFATSDRLREDVRGFVAQESMHRREHLRFNKRLCAVRGYDLARLEARVRAGHPEVNKTRPLLWLASTVAYEHFTAIIAHNILRNPAWLAPSSTEVARMWRWHATEEIEHKSVAFDLYMAAGGTRKMLRWVMIAMTAEFCVGLVGRNLMHILRRDRPPLWKTLGEARRFLFGRDGLVRCCWPLYRLFFKRDFRPGDIDDGPLLHAAAAEFGSVALSSTENDQ